MREALARAAYSGVLRLATPLVLARLWWRGAREPGYRMALGARLGFGAAQAPGAVWIHAVSLGETRAAAALVAALRAVQPDLKLLLTHGTATGREAGQALLRPGDHQTWLPYDTPGAVRRFLQRHRPVLGVLMETEVWPNLLHEAARAGVPMVLANARLSARSAAKGQRLRALLHPAGQRITLALAQTEADAQRLREAGVPRVEVCGNLKYDLKPDDAQLATGRAWRAAVTGSAGRAVVVAASTREGEEAELLSAWTTLPAPRPLLLLVPRHPQRFDEVAALAAAQGFSVVRRSTWGGDGPGARDHAADVWLGDSVGEMPLYFGLAHVGLQGGSFKPLGAHNFIEAAACGCPMVLGPSVFNFAEAAQQAVAAGAAWQVQGWAAALALVQRLLADEAARAAAEAAAGAFTATHRGAAARMAARVLSCLTEDARGR